MSTSTIKPQRFQAMCNMTPRYTLNKGCAIDKIYNQCTR